MWHASYIVKDQKGQEKIEKQPNGSISEVEGLPNHLLLFCNKEKFIAVELVFMWSSKFL